MLSLSNIDYHIILAMLRISNDCELSNLGDKDLRIGGKFCIFKVVSVMAEYCIRLYFFESRVLEKHTYFGESPI